MKKGDLVTINGYCYGMLEWQTKKRVLCTLSMKPVKGIVVGYSFIRTGTRVGSTEWEPGYLEDITNHKVWLVEPLTHGDRYIKPYKCQEEQIVHENL